MTLDLEAPDLMAKNTLDERTGFDKGLSWDLQGFEVQFDHWGGGESFPDVTEEPNQQGRASVVHERTSGHSLWVDDHDAETGNFERIVASDLIEVEGESSSHEISWL